MVAALEEAYRNQIMTGKFPACVLHLQVPISMVDVNVHPAKTEVKFLQEKAVFDCIHYGALGALNKTPDRPAVQFAKPIVKNGLPPVPPAAASVPSSAAAPKKENFFRTMTPEEFKTFSAAIQDAPQPRKEAAIATAAKLPAASAVLRQDVVLPKQAAVPSVPAQPVVASPAVVQISMPEPEQITIPEPEQTMLPMPQEIPWRMVGELYNSYIIVEQGEEAYLIDKHAAHERILFEKLKSNQEKISSQMLLSALSVRLLPAAAAELLNNKDMLEELGFEIEEFGDSTVLVRQIPMDLSADMAAEALESLAADLMTGRREHKETVRDEILHTVACKAAIKAGWSNDDAELLALVKQVMEDENLKHCPHGRPICITLSKKQLEKQFKRT
jgi:DNA mismatch repair protein MutL